MAKSKSAVKTPTKPSARTASKGSNSSRSANTGKRASASKRVNTTTKSSNASSTKRQSPQTKTTRAKRPATARTEPNRSANTTFSNENIAKSVRGAYEVIEKYMAEGQNIAREFSKSYSNLNLDVLPDEWQSLQNSWVKTTSQLLAEWTQAMSKSGEGLGTGGFAATPVFAIKSAKVTTAKGSLKSGAHRYEIKSGELTNGDKKIPFTVANSAAGDVTVGISIGARQANGVYTSNLVNAVTGEILGEIAIHIS